MTRSAAQLEADFGARVCVICGASACVVCPGRDAQWRDVQATRRDGQVLHYKRQTVAAIADINLCLTHAAERWPWPSHRTNRQRSVLRARKAML